MPKLDVIVRDAETGEALPGAEVKAMNLGPEPKVLAADGRGRCVIELPDKPGYFSFTATAPGRVFLNYRYDPASGPPPATVEMPVPKGDVVGGTVRDEQGRPIAGARITLILTPGCAPKSAINAGIPRDFAAMSDEQGQWRCERFPSAAMVGAQQLSFYYQASHPDFVSAGPNSMINVMAMDAARALRGDVVMKRGSTVPVRVVDAQGRAVAGAKVGYATDIGGAADFVWKDADADGVATFMQVEPGGRIVVVKGPGFAPELKRVMAPPAGESLATMEIALAPGRMIHGWAKDHAGQPIEGVAVRAGQWRNTRGLDWNAKTDAEGKFAWPDAPLDEVEISAWKEKYSSEQAIKVAPAPGPGSGSEIVDIKLALLVEVAGRVLDAKTGSPIRSFRVVPGQGWKTDSDHPAYLHWRRGPVTEEPDGRFRHTPQGATGGRIVLRIEAAGYLPSEPRTILLGEPPKELEIRLEPTARTAGVVVGLDGKPIEGVRLALVTPRANGADIREGQNRGPEVEVKSDAQGFFELPSESLVWEIIALHETGYALVTQRAFLEGGRRIALSPWVRIEGEVRVGDQVRGDEQVMVSVFNQPYFNPWTPRTQFMRQTRTDAQGRFVVEGMPATRGRVVSFITGMRQTGMVWRNEPWVAEPGETLRVTLGGTGQRVRGRIDWPSEPFYGLVNFVEHARHPAREFHTRQPLRNFSANVAEDGSFTIDDMPAGRYEWTVIARPKGWDNHREIMMIDSGEITVAESGPEIDLGVIHGDAVRMPKVGEPAPELSLATIHGGAVRLADLTAAGKRVLVCFWDTQLTDKVPSLERLKRSLDEVAAKGSAPDLVVLGVDMNAAVGWWGQPMPTLEASPAWNVHAVVRVSEAKLRAPWGVTDPSRITICLVGKDGRIEAADVKAEEVAGAVG
ncbi:MAG: hypothetical protein NTW19_06800 [Planctomycetota bacterium]|nr:hypothetical protein [Planctomycetota bacterium]